MKRLTKLACVLIASLYACQSFAVLSIVYDPYDVIQNTITAKNSVQSLINQAKQMQYDVENLKKLSKGHFENLDSVLNQLSNITSQGQSLSYGVKDIERQFSKKFPGMTASKDYHQDFTNWSGTTYDTLKNAMLAMSLQGKLFEKENDSIKELQQLSENAQGNLTALQTSHRIALQEISQLQKLKQLMLTQAGMQNTFMTYQLQKEQSFQAVQHEWVKQSQTAFVKYRGNSGFGANDLPQLPE